MPDTAARTSPAKTTTEGDEITQTIKRSGESLDHIARETMSCCSDTVTAAVNSGVEASQFLTEVTRSYLEACAGSAMSAMQLARESTACRTPADVLALQKKGYESVSALAEASVKLSSDFYAAWSKALQPALARVTDAPERMFRAFAD